MLKIITVAIFSMSILTACDDPDPETCGDGVVDIGEECDSGGIPGGSLCTDHGYNSGNVICRSDCSIDWSECEESGKCGNGIIEGEEECDSSNLDGKECVDVGYPQGGTLTCGDDCRLDRSQCSGYGECGNDIIDGTEQCDGDELGGETCEGLGFNGGTLFCKSDCSYDTQSCEDTGRCGDGAVDSSYEECDGTNFDGETCTSLGFYVGGSLSCDDCSFNTSACSGGYCGDGNLDSGFEDCDGDELGINTCELLGYYGGGNLSCSSDCTFDKSLCAGGYCGDGILQSGNEQCDSTSLGGNDCQSLGFESGSLSCNNSCEFDTALCEQGSILEDVIQWGTSSSENVYDVYVDNSGNAYVAGQTYGIIDGTTNYGGSDAFLTKILPDGTIGWSRQWGTAEEDIAYAVITDNSGNIYVSGHTFGSFPTFSNLGYEDIYLTKFDSTGNRLWTKQWGTTSEDYSHGIILDSTGNPIISSYTGGAMPLCINNGGYDILITKFDSAGNYQWSVQYGGVDSEFSYYGTVDSNGNIYISGWTFDTFNGNSSAGGIDAFLMKLDSTGAHIWTRQWGTTSTDVALGLTLSLDNHVYVTGYTNGTMPLNSSAGLQDVYVAKFDFDGNHIWTKQFGTTGIDEARQIVTTSDGSVYFTGFTDGALPGNTSAGLNDVFLIKLNSSGTAQWMYQWGTDSDDWAFGLAYDSSQDDFYIAGMTAGSFSGFTNIGQRDSFLLKY
ncbi:MAG: SBBP repeat-containing protein [Deltaproteobacteria bacterium]|nr:SBBP repeat-containing protein [Deltaproteobacteria bacterium]